MLYLYSTRESGHTEGYWSKRLGNLKSNTVGIIRFKAKHNFMF